MMNRRIVISGVAVLLALALPLTAAPSAEGEGAVRLEKETMLLSVKLLVGQWKENFARQPEFAAGNERIRQAMEAERSAFAARSTAYAAAEKLYREELKSGYRAGAEKLLAPFAGKLSSAEQTALTAVDENYFSALSARLFPAGFNQVRSEMAAAQRRRIFRTVYPAAEELEKLPDDALRKLLEARFKRGSGEALMEENLPLLRKSLILPAIREGRRQQQKQLELLRAAVVPDPLWSASQISSFLTQEITEKTAQCFPDAASRYPLFPATQAAICTRAAALPIERIAGAFAGSVNAEKYRELLAKESSAHLTPAQSWPRCVQLWFETALQTAFRSAGVPEKLRPEFAADPAALKIWRSRFAAECARQLQSERGKFAAVQLKEFWPELSGKWLPLPECTEKFAASGNRKLPPITEMPSGSEKLLVETRSEMERLVREKLIAESARLASQKQAVSGFYTLVLEKMTEKQQEFLDEDNGFFKRLFGIAPHQVTLKEIISCYEKQVTEKSSAPLFPGVRQEIEARSRAILQLLQLQRQKKTPLPKVVLTVRLTGENDKLTVFIGQWRKNCDGKNLPVAEISAELKRRMAEVKEPSEFEIRLLVSGTRIYYLTVDRLRRAIREILKECRIEDHFSDEKGF